MAVFLLSAAWLMFWAANRLSRRQYASGLDFTSIGDYVSAFLYQPFYFLLTLLLAGIAAAITIKILWDAITMLFHWSDPIQYKGLGLFVYGFYVAVQGYGYFPRLVLFVAAFFAANDAVRLLFRSTMKKSMKAARYGERELG